MKKLLIFIMALLLCSCSLSDLGNSGQENRIYILETAGNEYAAEAANIDLPTDLRYLYNHIDGWEDFGISLEFVRDALNSLSYDDMQSSVANSVLSVYKSLCSQNGEPSEVYSEFLNDDGRLSLICNSPETFYGPEASWNPYNITVSDEVFTPFWIFTHPLSDYVSKGITPDMIKEKIPYYREFCLRLGADTYLENKLSKYLGEEVSLTFSADDENDKWEKGYHVSYKMPEPFSDSSVSPKGYYDPDGLIPSVLKTQFAAEYEDYARAVAESNAEKEDWVEYDLCGYIYHDLSCFENIFSFAERCGITYDTLISAFASEGMPESDANRLADRISSNDINGFLNMICGDEAIISDGYFYTPDWLYTWSTDGWEMADITPEMIEERIPYYRSLPFTSEAREAFEYKLGYYLGHEVSLECVIEKDGEIYDLNWLACHAASDYENAGISASDIENFLDITAPSCGDTEAYGWISEQYGTMIG